MKMWMKSLTIFSVELISVFQCGIGMYATMIVTGMALKDN